MEKLYKILKIVLLVLVCIALVLAVRILLGRGGEALPQETVTAAPQDLSAPDFTFYDIDGNAHKLSDYRGKPVILNFWASWCGPCKAEMPDFEEAYQQYGQDIQFLIVNLTDGSSETVETASEYIGRQGYTFPVFYDTDLAGAQAYGVYAIPITYFLDGEGQIRAINEAMISAEALQQNIEALLNAE